MKQGRFGALFNGFKFGERYVRLCFIKGVAFIGNAVLLEWKMGAINIPAALKQMDGVFGCNVSVTYNPDTELDEFTFSKKTIVDFFCGLFASADEKSRINDGVILALGEIKNQVGTNDKNRLLEDLLLKYISSNDLIDFKEIRNTLRKFSNVPLPPVVFPRNTDFVVHSAEINLGNLVTQNFPPDTVKANASLPFYLAKKEDLDENGLDKNGRLIADFDEIESFLIYQDKAKSVEKIRDEAPFEASTFTPTPKKIFPKGFSNAESEKEVFEKLYLYRVGESIRDKTYTVELVCGPDGDVSNDNLDALAETIVSIEWLTKRPISVSFAEKDGTKFKLISDRLDAAFVTCIAEQGNPFNPVREIDLETVKRELETSVIHSARLYSG